MAKCTVPAIRHRAHDHRHHRRAPPSPPQRRPSGDADRRISQSVVSNTAREVVLLHDGTSTERKREKPTTSGCG